MLISNIHALRAEIVCVHKGKIDFLLNLLLNLYSSNRNNKCRVKKRNIIIIETESVHIKCRVNNSLK